MPYRLVIGFELSVVCSELRFACCELHIACRELRIERSGLRAINCEFTIGSGELDASTHQLNRPCYF